MTNRDLVFDLGLDAGRHIALSPHRIHYDYWLDNDQYLFLYRRGSENAKGILDYESHSRNPTGTPTRLSCLLNSCHLFPTLGLVHILTSVLVRLLLILGSPMENTRLYNDRYDRLVSFDQSFRVSLRSLTPSIDYTFLFAGPMMLRTCL